MIDVNGQIEAKGRNGFFKIKAVGVSAYTSGGKVISLVEVFSRTIGPSSPVCFSGGTEEMLDMFCAILDALASAKAEEEKTREVVVP